MKTRVRPGAGPASYPAYDWLTNPGPMDRRPVRAGEPPGKPFFLTNPVPAYLNKIGEPFGAVRFYANHFERRQGNEKAIIDFFTHNCPDGGHPGPGPTGRTRRSWRSRRWGGRAWVISGWRGHGPWRFLSSWQGWLWPRLQSPRLGRPRLGQPRMGQPGLGQPGLGRLGLGRRLGLGLGRGLPLLRLL